MEGKVMKTLKEFLNESQGSNQGLNHEKYSVVKHSETTIPGNEDDLERNQDDYLPDITHTEYHIHKDGKKVGELHHENFFGNVHGDLHGKDLPEISKYSNGKKHRDDVTIEDNLHGFLKSKTGSKWASNIHTNIKQI